MKTPEQIAGAIYDRDKEWAWALGERRLIPMMVEAIELDRAQRNADLIKDLRQIRAEKGDWRGVLDSLIGDNA